MTYNFNIKAGGYDLPAFIKNPYKVFTDNSGNKNILDLLKLTDKRWLHGEEEYNILKYDKSKVTPDLVRTSGLFRSIVHSNGAILAFSPPKSICEGQFMSQYPPSECYAEEIVDGTMINLFYDKLTKAWEISSKSTFGANCLFFNNS